MKKESSRARATLLKTKSSRVGAMLMKRKALELEQCHFYDGSAALFFSLRHFSHMSEIA